MEKEGFVKGLGSDLNWGLKGLKVSLCVLVLIFVFLFVFLYVKYSSLSLLTDNLFQLPNSREDYLVIFAGGILFIAVPFLLGIRIGLEVKGRRV